MRAVLQQARNGLAAVDEFKLAASRNTQPQGSLRLGVVHALADPTLADSLRALGARYPELNLRLSSGGTSELLPRMDKGELDAAVVFVAGRTRPGHWHGAPAACRRPAPSCAVLRRPAPATAAPHLRAGPGPAHADLAGARALPGRLQKAVDWLEATLAERFEPACKQGAVKK